MKKITLFIAVMLSAASMTAQQNVETVHLKNGGLVKGEIIEQVPNESLKVRTKDGSVFAYQMDEVEKITKEEASNVTQATGHRGLDFNIDLGYNIATKGGGGSLAAGLELGKRVNKNFYFGVGAGTYISSGNGDISIPITADFKVYYPLNNTKIAPFLGLKAGYVINTADVTYTVGKQTYTTEIPDAIMIEIMPGVQIPLSNSIDFNVGIGYAHSIPTKGSGSGGAIAIRAGFGFHKSMIQKVTKNIPTRDKGFQLTLEADGTNLWSIGADSHFITGGGNLVFGYKVNPNISVGVGYGGAYMDARASLITTTYTGNYDYKENEKGKKEVITNENTIISSDKEADGEYGAMHKFFVRGQYRLKNDRFSPIVNIDLGFRNLSFTYEKDYYGNLRSVTGRYGDDYDSEYNPNKSSLFISPSVGFSLRTTNNSYFEMRLGYMIAGKIDGKTADKEYYTNKMLSIYEQKARSTSGGFLTIGWTHTFGSRK